MHLEMTRTIFNLTPAIFYVIIIPNKRIVLIARLPETGISDTLGEAPP